MEKIALLSMELTGIIKTLAYSDCQKSSSFINFSIPMLISKLSNP